MRKLYAVYLSAVLLLALTLLILRAPGGSRWRNGAAVFDEQELLFSSRQRELVDALEDRVDEIIRYQDVHRARLVFLSDPSSHFRESSLGRAQAGGDVLNEKLRRAVGNLSRGTVGCSDFRNMTGIEFLGSGYTKTVLKGTLQDGTAVAVKTVNSQGDEVKRCIQRYGQRRDCFRLAACKIIKELTLLQKLQHPNIIQLYGQCYYGSLEDGPVITVMEQGIPVEMIQLLQTPWEERFRICLSLVKLLHYLAHSPLGSVLLLDFQPRQFVLVDGELKVTDLDDVSTEELSCKTDRDCVLEFPTRNFSLRCAAEGKCHKINEKRNLYNAFRFFFTYLLPYSAPTTLRPLLWKIMNATGELQYGINETLEAFEEVLYLYKSGLHHTNHSQSWLGDYKIFEGFRIQDNLDYKCWPSYNYQGCLLSVHNREEAAAICQSQQQCQSFTFTQQKTWLGRYLVSFRSSTELVLDINSTVYMKLQSLRARM
ncbi:extracellular tyrosine-protein kinase PKDCC-like [Stegostoma tigrinum]|uniref:extracellular tyrosine-protein kinase PKDCC-like n=1 Tax=Stegostoma tigrinum TaxID=3053191 RepID=UPI00202B7D52|nr:extracellular tyrosine-protein kinase PKDCC-like [Stegostoma tigrinum]